MPTQQGVLKMNRHNITRSVRHAAGFSLVESLIAVATTSVALGFALPGFEGARERRSLDAGAAQLKTDLQLARSEAVAHNRTLRVSYFNDTGSGSCYVVHTGGSGDCRCGNDGATTCHNGSTALRSAYFAAGEPVQMRSNVASIVLDPTKGTVSPTGTVRFTGRNEKAVHVVVNIMGRVRACTPIAAKLPGYPTC